MTTKTVETEQAEYVPYLPKKYDLTIVNELYRDGFATIDNGELYITLVAPISDTENAELVVPLSNFCNMSVPGLTSFVNNKQPEPVKIIQLRKAIREYRELTGGESAELNAALDRALADIKAEKAEWSDK